MTVNESDQQFATTVDITGILVRNCGLDPDAAAAAPDMNLEDLGMDSLAMLELQAVVVDRFKVEIPEQSGTLSIPQIAVLVRRQQEA